MDGERRRIGCAYCGADGRVGTDPALLPDDRAVRSADGSVPVPCCDGCRGTDRDLVILSRALRAGGRRFRGRGPAGSSAADCDRIDILLRRIVRSLSFLESGVVLPAGYGVFVLGQDDAESGLHAAGRLTGLLARPELAVLPLRSAGGGFLRYCVFRFAECPSISLWSLHFVSETSFIAYTGPLRFTDRMRHLTDRSYDDCAGGIDQYS